MMTTRPRSIRRRLIALSALSSTLALLLACAAFLGYELITFRRLLVADLTADAQMLAFSVTAPLLFDDPDSATASLQALRAKPRIRSARVLDGKGRTFASYGQAPAVSTPGGPLAAAPWHSFGNGSLVLGMPVISEGATLGAVILESSLVERDRRIRQYLLLTASVLLVALIAALGVSNRVQRRILQPVTRLTDAAHQVLRNADYSVRVEPRSDDELGVLGRTFNQMLEKIEEQNAGLKASEVHYRLLFENSPLPMWLYDVESLAFLAVNEAAVRHYGYSQEEFLRMTIEDIRPPEDAPLVASAAQHLPLHTDGSRWRHRKKDGTLITVEISSHGLTLDGRAARLVLATDVTARERALEALRRSDARFGRLLEAGIVGIVISDNEGNILEANDAFLAIVGYDRDDLRAGRIPVADMTPTEWRALNREASRLLAASGTARPFEKEYLRKDGTRVPVLVGVATLDDASTIALVLDVTERKRLEQVRRDAFELEQQNRRIQEANRLKSEFLANMSHELRTPLNAILGFGELLHDGEVPPESPQHREFLGDILKSGRHLLQLINDVLDLAKVEAGKVEFRPEPIQLEAVIDEVISIVRAMAVAKKIRLSTIVEPELKTGIFLDPARLKQVLYNFISNALKFTPDGGTVAVRARAEGEASLVLEVEDTGPGIAPQDVGRLFVEFQQLDAGAAKHHGGTGLGLALTRRLVEAQGGSVGLRSTPGKGSVFHAILPRRGPAGPLVTPTTMRIPAPPGTPSVLVVEDDSGDRALLIDALGRAGYAVESAGSGSEALALCAARKFDALSLDLLLPDMSGQEVLRQVRTGSGPNRDVPVVVVTVVAERGAIAGFAVQDFLPKPIDTAALLASLGRAGIRPERPGSVLVVDDDASALKLMGAALTQLGFRALCLKEGAEALRVAASSPPAAVVLDLLMPGMDGFEFLDRLRESPATRSTPVLIWTVKDLSPPEQERLARSAQAIVRKGHGGIPALLEDLRRLLSQKRDSPA